MLSERPASALESRLASISDAPMLAEFAARTFVDAFSEQNDPDDMAGYVAEAFSVAKIEAEIHEGGTSFLVGFDPSFSDVAPVAYCRLIGGSREDGVEGPDPVELQRLYVEPRVRGSGYGGAMMWDALEAARELGHQTIWLGVWEENHGAQRFYRRWGFDVVGSHEFVLTSDRQRDLLMARSL